MVELLIHLFEEKPTCIPQEMNDRLRLGKPGKIQALNKKFGWTYANHQRIWNQHMNRLNKRSFTKGNRAK